MTNQPTRIRFVVPGVPVPQPRQRHRSVKVQGKGGFVQNYTPQTDPVNAFKAAVRLTARGVYRGPPLLGPLRVDLLFLLPRTKAEFWKTKPMPRLPHPKKPDRDNLDKAVLDALTGLLWLNDSQVCDGRITKLIAAGDEQPHTVVTVTPFYASEANDGQEEKSKQEKNQPQQALAW